MHQLHTWYDLNWKKKHTFVIFSFFINFIFSFNIRRIDTHHSSSHGKSQQNLSDGERDLLFLSNFYISSADLLFPPQLMRTCIYHFTNSPHSTEKVKRTSPYLLLPVTLNLFKRVIHTYLFYRLTISFPFPVAACSFSFS